MIGIVDKTLTLEKMYSLYRGGEINRKDLLIQLSLYDEMHEEPLEVFQRRVRLKRTIVTDINRCSLLQGRTKVDNFMKLADRYLKEYLYHFTVTGDNPAGLSFKSYLRQKIENSTLLSAQYSKIKDRDKFWSMAADFDEEFIRRGENEIM